MRRTKQKLEKLKVLIWFDPKKLDELDHDKITDKDKAIYSTFILRPEHKEFENLGPEKDHCSQEEFARMVNQDPSRISRLLARGVLTPAMPWRIWFTQWLAYSEGYAAGRKGSGY